MLAVTEINSKEDNVSIINEKNDMTVPLILSMNNISI